MSREPRSFDGFGPKAFAFLSDLAREQNREWFNANKGAYEACVRGPMRDLVGDLSAELARRKSALRGDPERAVFRIHRDVRFSKDKRPYKTNVGAVLTRDGASMKVSPGLLYVHIDPDGCFMATGFYQPEPAALDALRQRIAAEPKAFRSMTTKLTARNLTISDDDEALKRTPRGFESVTDDDIAEALRRRTTVIRRPLSKAEVGKPALVDTVADFAVAAAPLLDFGWRAIDGR